jgi:hypothetical protein
LPAKRGRSDESASGEKPQRKVEEVGEDDVQQPLEVVNERETEAGLLESVHEDLRRERECRRQSRSIIETADG